MSQDLVLHLRRSGTVRWSILDRLSGARLRQGEAAPGEALEIGDAEGVARTLCLLPSESIFLSRITVPARTDREARQAAPFMIEDELASSLDTTEVVLGERSADGPRWIAAVDRQTAEDWHTRLEPALVRPVFTLPDSMAVPVETSGLSVFDRGDGVLLRPGSEIAESGKAWGGFADYRLFDRVLPAFVAKAGSGKISVSPSLGLAGANLSAFTIDGLDREALHWTDAELTALPALFGQRLGSSFDWGELVRPWRTVAALAASALVAFGLLLGGEALYLRHQADRFDAASVDLFQAAFPDVAGVALPTRARRILDQRLAGIGGGGDSSFLTLTSALAELTADNEQIRIDHIRYDQARAGLTVSAIYSEFSDFDALSLEARTLGVLLDDQGTREGDRGIEGDFVLRLQ